MVVDEACCLQKGVADGCAEEFEAPFSHIAAYGVGFGCRRRYFCQCAVVVYNGLPVWHKRQYVVAETAILFLDAEKEPCVGDCRFYLQPVTDYAAGVHQSFYVGVGHLSHFFGVEVVECRAVSVAFFQYCYPAQSCLCAFEQEEFE